MLSSMAPSTRSTAVAKAQKVDAKSGHRSVKGGMTTKILALTDALGNLVRFVLTPGQRVILRCALTIAHRESYN